MSIHIVNQFRFIPVIALLGIAVALLRRRGQPPLALRGLQKVLGKKPDEEPAIPLWRRLLAMACVLAALILAVI